MNDISREPVNRKSIFLAIFLPLILAFAGATALGAGVAMESMLVVGVSTVVIIVAAVIHLVMVSGVIKGVNGVCECDEKHLMPYIGACVLSLVTLGIFGVYYFYKVQSKICEVSDRFEAGVKTKASTVLIWCIIGLFTGIGSIIACVLIISSYNRLAAACDEESDAQWEADLLQLQQARALQMAPVEPEYPEYGVMRCIAGVTGGPVIRFDRNRKKATLGRNPKAADVVILNNRVSRVHCDINFDEKTGTFYVTDRNSTNGILIKGSRGTKKPAAGVPVAIGEGDLLILPEDITFEFEVFK